MIGLGGSRGNKRRKRRSTDQSKRDFSLREPTRSQEANAKKRRRLTPFEMTVIDGGDGSFWGRARNLAARGIAQLSTPGGFLLRCPCLIEPETAKRKPHSRNTESAAIRHGVKSTERRVCATTEASRWRRRSRGRLPLFFPGRRLRGPTSNVRSEASGMKWLRDRGACARVNPRGLP
jgi:hypothetical protein